MDQPDEQDEEDRPLGEASVRDVHCSLPSEQDSEGCRLVAAVFEQVDGHVDARVRGGEQLGAVRRVPGEQELLEPPGVDEVTNIPVTLFGEGHLIEKPAVAG